MSVTASSKGSKYLHLLQDARLNSQWSQVAELTRKVDKHASQRSCLTITAGVEAQIVGLYRNGLSSKKDAAENAAEDALVLLAQAIEAEVMFQEDAFEARVCIQQIHLNLGHWDAVVGNIQKEIEQELDDISRKSSQLSPYLRICVLKSKYCVAMALEHRSQTDDARDVYQATISYINSVPASVSTLPEARFWIARILARSCALDMHDFSIDNTEHAATALRSFRAWASFWNALSSCNIAHPDDPAGPDTRRRIWGLYYHLSSVLLELGKDRAPTYMKRSVSSDATASHADFYESRLAQRIEFRHVERSYETLLLSDTDFPNAHEDNRQLDLWATQFMVNWRMFDSNDWRGSDLDQGGKESLGRVVLDMLYRAAAKTFHSTAILRYLFQVHASLADFVLAIKAFDSYIDIVAKGRARAEKTGKNELGLDNMDTICFTVADCVNLLCSYGARDEAEKAVQVAHTLLSWLPPSNAQENGASPSIPSLAARSAAHRAVGQSKAHWASLTYDTSERASCFTEARTQLESSVEIMKPADPSIETLSLLARVCTAVGDVNAAMKILKSALTPFLKDDGGHAGRQLRRVPDHRRLIPLWHHLVLLLTAKEEYETALSTCSVALTHYVDALYHAAHESQAQVNDSLENTSAAPASSLLESYTVQDKINLVQLKMTEIELLATLQGASAVILRISEPLSLYARLFGSPIASQSRTDPSNTRLALPNKASHSTLRGFRNSILGRPKSAARHSPKLVAIETVPPVAQPDLSRPESSFDCESPISMRNADSQAALLARPSTSNPPTLKKNSQDSRLSAPNLSDTLRSEMTSVSLNHNVASRPAPVMPPEAPKHASAGDSASNKKGLRIFSNKSRKSTIEEPPASPAKYEEVLETDAPRPKPDSAMVTTLSVPRFPTAARLRQAQVLLVEIWLFVAGHYARDESFADQKGAIDEAARLVEALDSDTAASQPTARLFDDRGWGMGKSVSRLWADVWATRGKLALATSRPYDALAAYDTALDHFPDHPSAIIGLSNILLDIFEQKIPAEPPSSNTILITAKEKQTRERVHPDRSFVDAAHETLDGRTKTINMPNGAGEKRRSKASTASSSPLNSQASFGDSEHISEAPSPADLNRIAARSRACTLLSTLTKLGDGWANSEAWYVLARAYELSGQVERAKKCLWWVVGLEDGRPIRSWRVCTG